MIRDVALIDRYVQVDVTLARDAAVVVDDVGRTVLVDDADDAAVRGRRLADFSHDERLGARVVATFFVMVLFDQQVGLIVDHSARVCLAVRRAVGIERGLVPRGRADRSLIRAAIVRREDDVRRQVAARGAGIVSEGELEAGTAAAHGARAWASAANRESYGRPQQERDWHARDRPGPSVTFSGGVTNAEAGVDHRGPRSVGPP